MPTKTKTKTKAAPAAAEETTSNGEVTFGVKDILNLILKDKRYKRTGKRDPETKDIRNLIRKMAKDGSGRVNRKVIPGNKTPYNWPKGANDSEVQAIVEAWLGGEYEQVKQEKLADLKTAGAAKREAKKAKAASKAAAQAPDEDEDEDVEDEEEEDDDE